MLEQLVQVVEDADSFWIGDPALRLDKIDGSSMFSVG
jgi:hypothetical protein